MQGRVQEEELHKEEGKDMKKMRWFLFKVQQCHL